MVKGLSATLTTKGQRSERMEEIERGVHSS